MALEGLIVAGTVLGALWLDALVRPRAAAFARSLAGWWLLGWMAAALTGLFLALCGSAPVAAGLTLALLALAGLISNAKHAMLGEPLVFSDLALIRALFRHPQFYLSAIRLPQRVMVGLAALLLLGGIWWLSDRAPGPHLRGLLLLAVSLAVLALSLRAAPVDRLARVPDLDGDVRRHGLLPTLLLYWRRWRGVPDPPSCASPPRLPPADPPALLIVIQCESFADPVELFGDPRQALPALAQARGEAWQWGRLEVGGFGAYTMRTEYGVLFGRGEPALGFRRYDPFLTALGEASYALPARLAPAGWRSLFVHPHDLRFYGRDAIMPAAGFARLVGEEAFAPVDPASGRYVTDAAMAERIAALAREAGDATLIYAVTIENHGPWSADPAAGEGGAPTGYLRLVRRGDAMLAELRERLAELRRPALLVFFGDHRPSIPGATAPGADRHTPYVMIRLDAQSRTIRGDGHRRDLTPAGLHHAMLDVVLGPIADE